MINAEQARVIFDLVEDIKSDANALAYESSQGYSTQLEWAQSEYDDSIRRFENYIKSLTV